jgi:hypothetical protein
MSIEAVGERLQSAALGEAIRSIQWLVPLLQSIHIVMIGVVFVSVLVIALRVLGWLRTEQPMALVWGRFAPFLWAGLAVMSVTGILLTLSEPLRELMTLSWRLKMLLLVVGVAAALAFGRRVRALARAGDLAPGSPGAPFPASVRLAAAATVLLWLAVIFLGRAIAYDDSIWGDWSPAVLQRGGAL